MEFSQSYREMSILRKISRFFKLIGLRFKARKESRKEAHRIHKENRALLKKNIMLHQNKIKWILKLSVKNIKFERQKVKDEKKHKEKNLQIALTKCNN